MLIHPHDADASDQWRRVVATEQFGQLVAPGERRRFPVVVPTPYLFLAAEPAAGSGRASSDVVLVHFQRSNPVWAALDERAEALFCVTAAQVFVESTWNALPERPPEHGVPTALYAAVQLECRARPVDDPGELAALLRAQTARFQPQGGHAPIAADAPPYAALLPAIRGLELRVEQVRAKFKFAAQRSREHRERIAAALAERDGPGDREARAEVIHTLRRTPG